MHGINCPRRPEDARLGFIAKAKGGDQCRRMLAVRRKEVQRCREGFAISAFPQVAARCITIRDSRAPPEPGGSGVVVSRRCESTMLYER